jgi:DNA-binding CsgD family transcriptional regulator
VIVFDREGLAGVLARDTPAGGGEALTPRQREVLRLLAEGRSMKQAGMALNIAARTVAFHKYQLMARLKIRTNAELIKYAVRHDIV